MRDLIPFRYRARQYLMVATALRQYAFPLQTLKLHRDTFATTYNTTDSVYEPCAPRPARATPPV